MRIERVAVGNQVVNAVAVGDQESPGIAFVAQAADVVFALEDQFGGAAVSVHLPGGGGGVAAYRDDVQDGGHEFALGEFIGDQAARRFREIIQAIDPLQFLAFGGDERNTAFRCAQGKGAHRRDAVVRRTVGPGVGELAVGVALQCEAHARTSSARCSPRGGGASSCLLCAM